MSVQWSIAEDPHTISPLDALVVPLSSHIRRKREFFGVMRKHLRWLHCYSDNWDALYDALRDLSSLTGKQQVVLQHAGMPFEPDSRQRAIYLEFLSGLLTDGGDPERHLIIVLPTTETAAIAHLRGVMAPSP